MKLPLDLSVERLPFRRLSFKFRTVVRRLSPGTLVSRCAPDHKQYQCKAKGGTHQQLPACAADMDRFYHLAQALQRVRQMRFRNRASRPAQCPKGTTELGQLQ